MDQIRHPLAHGRFPVPPMLAALCLLLLLPACSGRSGSGVGRIKPGPACQAGEWTPLVNDLIRDGFNREEVCSLFTSPKPAFDPAPMRSKLDTLFRLYFGKERTREIQAGLAELGFAPGPADGAAGGRTREAIKGLERLHGLEQKGEPSDHILKLVRYELSIPEAKRLKPKPREAKLPAEISKPVHAGVLKPERLAEARAFHQLYAPALNHAEQTTGVPAEFITAILTIETRLGQNIGQSNAFAILAGLALCRDFRAIEPSLPQARRGNKERAWLAEQAKKKGDWAYEELKALLAYADHLKQDPREIPGSIYGAIGLCQFMPTNAMKFAKDADQDGAADLFTIPDAILSVGVYLKNHGWPRDPNNNTAIRQAILNYNHSGVYANTVQEIANHLKSHK